MKKIQLLVATALTLGSISANAALINFTGNIDNHNDVVTINFTLNNDATNVRVWTDSFMSGTNFDPITALWDGSGNLISENDDDDSINPATQTWYDSGFFLPTLTAGSYIFTVATYNNFANGSLLSDGFAFDNDAPIPLSQWCQPANNCGMGTYWSVWLDGVDSATGPGPVSVPTPATLALFGLGLLGMGVARRRHQG